jgi:hypothetical protein
MTTRPLGPAPLAVGLGTLICTCFGSGQSGDAADLNPPPPVRVAASAIDSDQSPRTRNELRSDGKIELEWLLAQSAGQTTVEARGETVIAVFPSSAPANVEEDVAKAHKLELVRRLAIGLSDKRIVVYRIGDGRNAAEVVAALKGDLRVGSVQANVRYTPLPQQRPGPPAVSDVKQPRERLGKQGQQQTLRRDAKVKPPVGAGVEERPSAARKALAIPPTVTTRRSTEQGSLVARNHTALRWPTADEPFVNIGSRNK